MCSFAEKKLKKSSELSIKFLISPEIFFKFHSAEVDKMLNVELSIGIFFLAS